MSRGDHCSRSVELSSSRSPGGAANVGYLTPVHTMGRVAHMTDQLWSEEHPVRQLLQARRASRSMPGNRDDPFKVGLAVEGGGLRGVVSAGMLVALEDLGYADAFDEVYTCSAGAINGAYFVARETWFPLTIYFDDLSSGAFLDFRRVLRGQAALNLDYVFDEVLSKRKPLDYAAIISAKQRLHVMVTDVDDLKPLDVTDFTSPEDLRSALRAGAWLPLATWGTATFRGKRAIDGAVLQFHPFRAAMVDGCTHILSLSTRPIGPPTNRLSLLNHVVARYLEAIRPGLGKGLLAGLRQYVREDKPRLMRNRLRPENDPAILDIAPLPGTPEVKRHETNPAVLLNAARSAYQLIYRVLDGEEVVVAPRLTVYRSEPDSSAGEIAT